jgi:hypothetical protein
VALVALIFPLLWLGAALLPYLRPLLGRHLGRWALIPPAASFLITLTAVTSTSHDQRDRREMTGLLSRLPVTGTFEHGSESSSRALEGLLDWTL